jgi:endo-1,4-beta-xylanase
MNPKSIFSILLLIALIACSKDKKNEVFPTVTKESTLRKICEDSSLFLIGSAYSYTFSNSGSDKVRYNEVLGSEFNYLQDTWSMSMESIWVGPDQYNFKYCDGAADFAVEHNMKLRGAHLLWHGGLPQWPEWYMMSDSEFETALHNYITTVITHFKTEYPGLITEWNVVNEVLDHDGIINAGETRFRPSIFLDKLGPDFVSKAFLWAHEADPDAKLYICEYDFLGNAEDNQGKADLLYQLVTELINAGIPIHGVGEQCHITTDYAQDMNYYSTEMDKYGNLGLDFQITECTVSINEDGTGLTDQKLKKQAQLLKEIVGLCLTKPYFTGFSFWGFTDRHSHLGSNEWPLIFDTQYVPKAAYYAIYDTLENH